MSALSRAANSNAVVSVFLLGCFGALSIRSMNRQRDIEALEAEKDSLVLANKAIKNTIWDWKKQLYTEAEAAEAADSKDSKAAPTVPLSRLKAIYGEVTVPSVPVGDADGGDGKSPASKMVIY